MFLHFQIALSHELAYPPGGCIMKAALMSKFKIPKSTKVLEQHPGNCGQFYMGKQIHIYGKIAGEVWR